MTKPTFASVTDEPCRCDYLETAANNPENPIVFEASTGEYHFSYGDAMLIIFHCPFCGGAAPPSKRPRLFTLISESERERLEELLQGIESIDDAIRKFGKPDYEGESILKFPERNGKPPRVERQRDFHYYHLSDVAEIRITQRPDGIIYWNFQGKILGEEPLSS